MSKVRTELKVALLVLVALLPLAYFSLLHVPSLYIDSIKLTIADEGMATPYALKSSLAKYRGKSLVSLSTKAVRKEVESLALIRGATVKKEFPSTLLVEATLVDIPALVYAKDEKDESVAVFVQRGSSLLALAKEDWALFEDHALKVEIPVGYALMMEKYGVDTAFQQVMELTASLEGNSTLITRIKYDNNSSNSFGKMILELSALHAQIWLREPVSAAQVRQAIQLVQDDQRESLSFLSSNIIRYDLYQGAMVRRK